VGALTYLPKPFTDAELLRVVGHYCPLGQRRPRRKTSLAVRLSNGAEDLVSPQLSPALG
jgi:hypothetical protein